MKKFLLQTESYAVTLLLNEENCLRPVCEVVTGYKNPNMLMIESSYEYFNGRNSWAGTTDELLEWFARQMATKAITDDDPNDDEDGYPSPLSDYVTFKEIEKPSLYSDAWDCLEITE